MIKRFILLLTILLPNIPTTGFAQSFLAQLYEQADWKIGSWAEYEVKNLFAGQENISQVKISILSREKTSADTLYWLEITTKNSKGDTDKMKVKMPKLSRAQIKEVSPIRELIIQHNDHQAVRLELNRPMRLPTLDALQNAGQLLDEATEIVGTEQITTKAGAFDCRHIRKTGEQMTESPSSDGIVRHYSKQTQNLWLSEKICTGVIKGQDVVETTVTSYKTGELAANTPQETKTSETHFLLLQAGDTGAVSLITGEPKNLSAPPAPPIPPAKPK